MKFIRTEFTWSMRIEYIYKIIVYHFEHFRNFGQKIHFATMEIDNWWSKCQMNLLYIENYAVCNEAIAKSKPFTSKCYQTHVYVLRGGGPLELNHRWISNVQLCSGARAIVRLMREKSNTVHRTIRTKCIEQQIQVLFDLVLCASNNYVICEAEARNNKKEEKLMMTMKFFFFDDVARAHCIERRQLFHLEIEYALKEDGETENERERERYSVSETASD